MKLTFAIILILTAFIYLKAQDPHQGHHGHDQSKDTTAHQDKSGMSHLFSLSLPANRNGSGTGWNPDNTPMYGYMHHTEKWQFMFHGNIFLRYNMQNINNDYKRGGKMFDAPNWIMAMGQRKTGENGLFNSGIMLSADRLTMGGDGYPLLFQSGESWMGKPLVDRQHPHDFFTSIWLGYTQRLNDKTDVSAYFGYPGEPALGPVAFMHRISALTNPDAPLGHHWQDATHITFGVATIGVRINKVKVEGSIFTGREPDENRFDLDKPEFDSYAGRILYNPGPSLALQVSTAFIKSPEALNPGEDVNRSTASISHSKTSHNLKLNSTFVWGLNDSGNDHIENSFLFESNAEINKSNIYIRYEWIEKSPDELGLETIINHENNFKINALSIGYSYHLFKAFKTTLHIGAQSSLNIIESDLEKFYGSSPLSAEIYLRITPELMNH